MLLSVLLNYTENNIYTVKCKVFTQCLNSNTLRRLRKIISKGSAVAFESVLFQTVTIRTLLCLPSRSFRRLDQCGVAEAGIVVPTS